MSKDKHIKKESERYAREKLNDEIVNTANDIGESKQAEQGIKGQEHFIKSVIEAVPELIGIFEIPSRKPLYWNHSPFSMTGYSAEEVARMSSWERMNTLVHPDHQEHLDEFYTRLERLEEGEITDVEYRFQKKASGEFWMHVKGTPFKIENGKVLQAICIARDISDEKRIEWEMLKLKDRIAQREKDKYHTLFNSMDEGYCIIQMLYDDKGKANDWRYLEVNKAFERHNGLTDATGKTIRELTPDIEQKWIDVYAKVAETGHSLRFVEDSNALQRIFDLYAFRIGNPKERRVAVLFTDITQRERAGKFLRESELWLNGQKQAFQAAMSGQPLAVSLGALVRMVAEQTGGEGRAAFYMVPPEAEGLHLIAGMNTDYAKEVNGFTVGANSLACGLAMHLGQPIITPDTETDPLWKDWRQLARKFNYRGCWSFPVRTTEGPVLGTFALYFEQPRYPSLRELELAGIVAHAAAIIMSRDVELYERTQAEKSLLASEKRLRELNESLEGKVKKRTKELTALKLDREKEKLNAIIFTQEQERARISEGLHDGVAQLLYAAQNMLQLVRTGEDCEQELKEALHILTEAIQETRKVSFELMPPILRDYGLEVCLKTLADRIAGGKLRLQWNVSIPGRLPEKLEITIYRIVQEILNNILKHAAATEATVSLKPAAKYLHLKVTDNGRGFVLKRSKSAYTGTGLQSIHNRVNLLNGKIRIVSAPGKGTDIELQLPLRSGSS